MCKGLGWDCPNCGNRLAFENQLIEQGYFDPETGEDIYAGMEDRGSVAEIVIRCECCGQEWKFEMGEMERHKKSLEELKKEYHGAPECSDEMSQPEMVYQIPEDLKDYLSEELILSYFDFEFKDNRNGENGTCLCRTNCPFMPFSRLLLRSLCAKKTQETGHLYLTQYEAETDLLPDHLENIYKKHTYRLVRPRDYPRQFLIIGDTVPESFTSWYPVKVNTPEILHLELAARGYTAQIYDSTEGCYCAVEDCPREAYRKIQDRTACDIKSFITSIPYLTKEEAANKDLREIIKRREHFTYNLIYEETDKSDEDEEVTVNENRSTRCPVFLF